MNSPEYIHTVTIFYMIGCTHLLSRIFFARINTNN